MSLPWWRNPVLAKARCAAPPPFLDAEVHLVRRTDVALTSYAVLPLPRRRRARHAGAASTGAFTTRSIAGFTSGHGPVRRVLGTSSGSMRRGGQVPVPPPRAHVDPTARQTSAGDGVYAPVTAAVISAPSPMRACVPPRTDVCTALVVRWTQACAWLLPGTRQRAPAFTARPRSIGLPPPTLGRHCRRGAPFALPTPVSASLMIRRHARPEPPPHVRAALCKSGWGGPGLRHPGPRPQRAEQPRFSAVRRLANSRWPPEPVRRRSAARRPWWRPGATHRPIHRNPRA